jgi:hypothetical protein
MKEGNMKFRLSGLGNPSYTIILTFILCILFSLPLFSQVLQWQGYWAGAYISGVPSDPWLVLQPTSAFNFQIINTSYSVVDNFTLPIPGTAIYYNVIAASPDFDTDSNIEVLYQYTDGTYYTGHVILRDIATSTNQLTFSDTDTTFYAYTFYFGNERVTIVTGTYNSSTHAWLYRSDNPQAIGETEDGSETSHSFVSLFPNPIVKFSEIHFSIPHESDVTVSLYDITGSRIRTLINTHLQEGEYTIPWYGTDSFQRILPSGTYFCAVEVDNQVYSKKVVVLH